MNLVGVSALFYKKGEKFALRDIEDYELPKELPIEDLPLEPIPDGEIHSSRQECIFTEDCITFSFSIINEGPLGEGYCSSIENEVDCLGWNYVMGDFLEDLSNDALEFRKTFRRKDGSDVGGVSFLVVVDISYVRSGGYWGEEEYESEISYLGRVSLFDFFRSLGRSDA